MARRPRPASRRPPQRLANQTSTNSAKAPPQVKSSTRSHTKPFRVSPPESEDEDEEESGAEEDVSQVGSEDDELEDDEYEAAVPDADEPRVAQWVDEDDLELEREDEDEEDSSEGIESESDHDPNDLEALQDDLSSLPLGALRKAQETLAQIQADEDSGEEDEEDYSDDDSAPEESYSRLDNQGKGKDEKPKPEIQKRKHKHAPTEVSSKRRPRRRLNTEKQETRDPRFLPITGQFDSERFRAQYGFLGDMHQDELKMLKENLKKARKMLASSPRDLRAEREQEVQRLERALKRTESLANKDRTDQIEQKALRKARREEKEKQQQGKKAWYMGTADKRELVTRAKFEALAEAGGRKAIKKAIDKKQKKVAQKEKKKRPFAPGGPSKRPPPARMSGESRPNKRQRVGS